VKDSSQSVRGIGVLLDYLDRLLFTAQLRCFYRSHGLPD
jgi:predicted CDP-diglyceride synthetase/phosphatidate cytidylyltransferase